MVQLCFRIQGSITAAIILIFCFALMVELSYGTQGCLQTLQDQRSLTLHHKTCVEYKKMMVAASQKWKDHAHTTIAVKAFKDKLSGPRVRFMSLGTSDWILTKQFQGFHCSGREFCK
jgi:hypothetical protein